MGGQEFYTEASRTAKALRTILFEGEGHVSPYTTSVTPYCY